MAGGGGNSLVPRKCGLFCPPVECMKTPSRMDFVVYSDLPNLSGPNVAWPKKKTHLYEGWLHMVSTQYKSFDSRNPVHASPV